MRSKNVLLALNGQAGFIETLKLDLGQKHTTPSCRNCNLTYAFIPSCIIIEVVEDLQFQMPSLWI